MTTPVFRGQARAAGTGRSVRLAALQVPLAVKLIGANLVVVLVMFGIWMSGGSPPRHAVLVMAGAVTLHGVLVAIALRPIRDLEAVASHVWRGDYGVRVERSSVADHKVVRVGSMFNILLDDLAADRARMRTLATEVIAAADRERAALARELHDSTAQQVAALLFQLATAARDTTDPMIAERLRDARDSAENILEEVRHLSHRAHPSVLDDLGLEAALRKLARDASHGTGVDIDVSVKHGEDRLPRNVEAVLYRVAQEAVRNATRHAQSPRVHISVFRQPLSATLEVHDGGRGFDLAAVERTGEGMGLLSMRERVELLDGSLEIKTAKGSGTTVSATVPLDAIPTDVHSYGRREQ
jgi:signal transduction histidine kinase